MICNKLNSEKSGFSKTHTPILPNITAKILKIPICILNIITENIKINIGDEKFGMEKLIISKSIRSFYKNPQQIAHKVLSDRMGERDPGNKPGPGDRIPYVYIFFWASGKLLYKRLNSRRRSRPPSAADSLCCFEF